MKIIFPPEICLAMEIICVETPIPIKANENHQSEICFVRRSILVVVSSPILMNEKRRKKVEYLQKSQQH